MPERKPSNLHFSCHCEGGTTEAISLKTKGLLRLPVRCTQTGRSFLTSRNDGSKLWVFVQARVMEPDQSHRPSTATSIILFLGLIKIRVDSVANDMILIRYFQ